MFLQKFVALAFEPDSCVLTCPYIFSLSLDCNPSLYIELCYFPYSILLMHLRVSNNLPSSSKCLSGSSFFCLVTKYLFSIVLASTMSIWCILCFSFLAFPSSIHMTSFGFLFSSRSSFCAFIAWMLLPHFFWSRCWTSPKACLRQVIHFMPSYVFLLASPHIASLNVVFVSLCVSWRSTTSHT